ncbi:hypothetical protein E9549_08700 [Blastococcus sp. MG754426]|uniref:hypothetical protein n=1 Tax=unclassified Blastococcus TaxID=2619396 RepID=UPI001EF0EAAF|nr:MULTISPECIES: hypothetical protein [unclassified Blastococcus]MCF6507487.1 hypothetical protein [Blastococcus sp. MG754426]MCF6512604.1 hypothetical protein [Blastococcus sp. MG754427]
MPEQAVPVPDRARRCRAVATSALVGGAAVLAPAPALAEVAAPAPEVRCSITDPRLAELSGLVDVGEQVLALNDGGEQVAVHGLDSSCAVVDVRTAAADPFDPEDLGVAPDGSVWVADIGDNGTVRPTVALHVLQPDGTAALHRLTYPDGAHDAEALLLAPDGTPYLVTKEVLGSSGVYRPAAALVDGGTVPLERVGTVNVTLTGTPGGPVGRAGQLLVTGGAVAADGSALALRTYTDAYVWPLTGSDVLGALAGEPVRVALPESPQGEAISFTADGQALVVASEGLPSAVTVVPVPAGVAATSPAPTGAPLPSLAELTTSSDRSPIAAAVIAATVATVVVWLTGRLRRRP